MSPGPVVLTVGLLVVVLFSTAALLYVLVKASAEGREEDGARDRR